MKRGGMMIVLLLVSFWLFGNGSAAGAQQEPCEWTVLFYFCGSDLESRSGFATENIRDIMKCYLQTYVESAETEYRFVEELLAEYPEENRKDVNVLIETGGSSAWMFKEEDPAFRTDVLQRWEYVPDMSDMVDQKETRSAGIYLQDEVPLANMADPETLSDFIRWGVGKAPAKKYALVLWNHGGGSKTGIFADELFQGDFMYLDELSQALADGGVHFECLVFDACLMANLETACAAAPYASWMVASEEVVPGRGTAIDSWLQELYNNPLCDGRVLGRSICDLTQIKYGDQGEDASKDMLTWSLIRLDAVERLSAVVDRFFALAGDAYENRPQLLRNYMKVLQDGARYGNPSDGMEDLGSVIYGKGFSELVKRELRNEIREAFAETVDYCVRGSGRSSSRGLSFCYAPGLTQEELDGYVRNCCSPHYLALLDALSDWEAPQSLYEDGTVRKLTNADRKPDYRIGIRKTMLDGIPGIVGNGRNIRDVHYRLYQLDTETDELISLGSDVCIYSFLRDAGGEIGFVPYDLFHRLAVDGEICCCELLFESENTYVYNVPAEIGRDTWDIRIGCAFEESIMSQIMAYNTVIKPGEYTVYGLWRGYDSASSMPGRDVRPLSQMAGREYRLLFPAADRDGKPIQDEQLKGEIKTLFRTVELKEVPLPMGMYFLEYEITDLFGRKYTIPPVAFSWSGAELSLTEGTEWEGVTEFGNCSEPGANP